MSKFKKMLTKHAGATAGILVVLLTIVTIGLSWITTCGIIKLITMCFGWTFNWGIATGIWLLMGLARTIFGNTTTVKK